MIGSKKIPAIKTEYAVAITSYVTADDVFHEGDRLRADHPEVKARPLFWASDGLGTTETQQVRQERLMNPLIETEAAKYSDRELREHQAEADRLAEAEHAALAELERIRALRLAGGY